MTPEATAELLAVMVDRFAQDNAFTARLMATIEDQHEMLGRLRQALEEAAGEETRYRALLEDARRLQTRAATVARETRADRQARRAAELRHAGLSAAVTGIRMAREDGRPDDRPYSERQVRRWLARALKG